eukprot:scaffold312_cov409-Pavlova_lutheri.AAC.6
MRWEPVQQTNVSTIARFPLASFVPVGIPYDERHVDVEQSSSVLALGQPREKHAASTYTREDDFYRFFSNWIANKAISSCTPRLRSNLRIGRNVYYTGKYWNDIPFVRLEVFHRRATGRPDVHWDACPLERRGEAFQKAFILNAGDGWVERSLVDKNILLSGVGIDFVQDFVDDANAEARSSHSLLGLCFPAYTDATLAN